MMRYILKKRSKVVSIYLALTNLIMPGLGQLMGGRLRRALIILGLWIILNCLLITSGVLDNAFSAISFMLLAFAYEIFIVIDAYKINANKNGIVLQWYNKWYIYVISGMAILMIMAFLPNYMDYYKTFRIASDGNAPALQTGEIVMMKKIVSKASNAEYKEGSFIVFSTESNDNAWIKRIVAMGGDNFSIKNSVAYLNGKRMQEDYVILANNKTLRSENFGPVKVPTGSVLVLGDNRDNSKDSWEMGFIPQKNISGKVIYILFSRDIHRIGLRMN
ncbi:MAG: signal peptidase I [Gammaproteobacteria bacterium]